MTATFSNDTTRNSWAMLSCITLSSTMVNIADTTMNRALRMLLAAITRARSFSAVRDWINAYSGTM
ncbi:hypothetical protein D3C76_1538750 [compost metagenome]